jgi:coenzyme PQQ synthesis protein D (PqqD)
MKKSKGLTNPLARKEGLVIKELADEVLVYNLNDDRAHCLNQTAAFVWQRCDGRTTPRKIAQLLCERAGVNVDERIVWLALDQLADKELLVRRAVPPRSLAGMNRRQLVRALPEIFSFRCHNSLSNQ